MSEWSDRSISTLLFKQASTIKMEVCVFVIIIIIVISEKVPCSY
jgi:SET domain-containing protein